MMILYFLHMLVQFIWMELFYSYYVPLIKTEFEYRMDDYDHKMTIYKYLNIKSKKYLVFISGSYQMRYVCYIKKMIFDLKTRCPKIYNEYEILVIEKHDVIEHCYAR